MDRERLDDRLEKGILGLVTLILIWAPMAFGSVRPRDEMIVAGLTVLALGLWVVRFWVRSEYRILWPPFAWTVIIFVGYVIWQYTRAEVEYVARLDLNRVILYAAIFFLVLDNLNRQEWTQWLVMVLIFVGMVMSMYAIYQYLTGSKWIYGTPQPAEYNGRAGGPFVCPNHLASYLGMTTPLAFALTMMARLKALMKVFLCYAGIVMLCGLVVTVSRAGLVSAGIGLLVLFSVLVFTREFRLPAIVAIALILIPAIWLAATSFKVQARLKKGMASGQLADDRFNVWPAAKTMWREHFWTGVGPNHFDVRFRSLRPPLAQLQGRPVRVHNDYLNTLADYGMIGFTLIAAAWGVYWLSFTRIWRFVRRGNDIGSRQSTRAATVLGASAGLVALLCHIILDFDMHIPALAIVVVTLLAIVSGHWRFATEKFWFNPGVFGRLVASVICLATMAWMCSQIPRLAMEYRYLVASDRAKTVSERLTLLQKAYAAEPGNPRTPYEIGEIFRVRAWNGMGDYRKLAEEAITWHEKSIALDPYDAHGFLGKALCLDWLDRPKEAWPLFRHALVLDPNSYFTRAYFGWHIHQLGEPERALKWFLASLNMRPNNPIAQPYYEIMSKKVIEEREKKAKAITNP